MALSQKQVLKQSQRIELSKVMLMNLIQTPNEELREAIDKELDSNPALEIDRDNEEESNSGNQNISIDEMRTQDSTEDFDGFSDDWESEAYETLKSDPNESHFEHPIVTTFSFREKLLMQLGELDISERDYQIAEYIIGNLEDTGYLLRENRSIVMDLLLQYNIQITEDEVNRILVDIIQSLEPVGVGARNLQECMLIQLRQLALTQPSKLLEQATRVVQNQFDNLTKKRYSAIQKNEDIPLENWEPMMKIIQKLVPYPGESSSETSYAIPDFIITIENDELILTMSNEYKPKLRVSKEYEDLYAKYRKNKNQEVLKFINENIERAKSFITALPERDRTMYVVVSEIMKFQKDFFLTGDRKQLKPMVLRDIAEKVDMDVSTISRVTSRRYVQTPYGILLLKDLFTEATNVEDGISSEVLRQEMVEIIEKEDKKKPLTDEKIAELLLKRGYQISRRTVAKYREQLGILSTSMRRIR